MFKHTLELLAAASAPLAILAPAVSAADPATVSPFVSPVHTEFCRHEKPHAPGTTLHRIESGGLDRQYLLYVPKGYDGASPIPLVFDFHGSGSNPEEELQVSGMASAAERHGFVVLLPVAAVPFPLGGFTWDGVEALALGAGGVSTARPRASVTRVCRTRLPSPARSPVPGH